MTLLEKIDYLMDLKKINLRSLAKQAGIPYTTLCNLKYKGTQNLRLNTLKQICDYFNVTMDSMAREEIDMPVFIRNSEHLKLSPEEKDIVLSYRAADELTKELVKRAMNIDTSEINEKRA